MLLKITLAVAVLHIGILSLCPDT
jgi:hypothetical protein